MLIKDLIDENFQDYKKTSMFICACSCDGKCWRELGLDSSICQNDKIKNQRNITMDDDDLIKRYLNNPITKAIIWGGLEPFDSFEGMYYTISKLRISYGCEDDVVIYTGYNKDEILNKIEKLKEFPNIIIKYGRYIPNQESKYDDVLGITLASPNQYAEKIS